MDDGPSSNGTPTRPLPLGALLLRAFTWFDSGLLDALNAQGWAIKRSHSLLFAHLDPGGTPPAELARRIGVSRQAIHETIAELEQMGLVRKVPHPSSRRSSLLVLTDRGRESVPAAHRAFAHLERELGRRIGSRRVAALRQALEEDWGRAGLAGPRRRSVS